MNNKSNFFHLVAIPVTIYFLIELLSRLAFIWIPKDMQNFKIVRDSVTLCLFILFLKKYKYLSSTDFRIDWKIVLILGSLVSLFIYFFTEQARSIYPLYQIFSAIFIAPVIEELICRKFIYDFFLLRTNIFLAIFISSVFFVFLHFTTGITTNIFYFSMSLVFTATRVLSGSVTNSIIVHIIANLTMAIRI